MHEKGQKNPPVQEHIAIFIQYLDFFPLYLVENNTLTFFICSGIDLFYWFYCADTTI